MSDPAVLVPSGLAQIHPQLETSIKSIAVAIRSLQTRTRTSTVTATAGGGTAEPTALQQQVQALQAQLGAFNQGRGFALFCS